MLTTDVDTTESENEDSFQKKDKLAPMPSLQPSSKKFKPLEFSTISPTINSKSLFQARSVGSEAIDIDSRISALETIMKNSYTCLKTKLDNMHSDMVNAFQAINNNLLSLSSEMDCLKRRITPQASSSIGEDVVNNFPKFPIKSEAVFENFEEELKQDDLLKKALIQRLASIGGDRSV